MPNHVTNIVEASPVVIQSMLNDDGAVDFDVILPMPDDLGINGANGFYGDAENAAKLMCKEKLSDNPLFFNPHHILLFFKRIYINCNLAGYKV
ncbi:hypothetical protein [Xenorhabdus siamensis]|uniref:hypothetical protein n=1 Tax=Xenorhabdus siamensis TaxID=3136254 RepID=UPI0030F400B4